ncbi:superoxide dismutase [Pseudoflavitalea sp. G-6-1-2]|uniref:superoxide dismutase n=1 Tax=Pseudoflavitalea sp. G-6-1-2 TaxID=2728841 RepID=UPI00146BCA9E|nr:superoxide dismutase [Pseudoflavitalea sp. G-6-1-2]NML20698.1 superoxide dismutase [Pseudoflavitalea sp. G-6-1-2]
MKPYSSDRRNFILNVGKAALSTSLAIPAFSALASSPRIAGNAQGDDEINYQQQPLQYGYNAIEPAIDAMTMEIHYTKHAATYAKNLAEAVKAENVNTSGTSVAQLLAGISKYSAKMRNNAGGHYNHELFWKSLRSPKEGNAPSGKLAEQIIKDFNSFEAFKTQFAEAAKSRFGSGWAWLVQTNDKKLVISSTPNQDNPLMDLADLKGFPVLGLDVWEHAYYLKYQNKRPDYITAWWNAVNWDFVQQRFGKR